MNEPKLKRKDPLKRLSTLLVLVLFIFFILLISFVLSGATVFLLIRRGTITHVGERNLIGMLLFLLLMSLGIGTIISAIGGTLFLRPLRRLIDATGQVASGNFDVRVEATGPYEMQRLTHSFNDMTRELGSIETLRSDFVSNVSHEFKTPVSSIRGFARLLKRDGLTPQQRNDYLDIILQEADRLTQLSGNVLLLSNLDSASHIPDQADFSLDEQLRQSVLLLEPQFAKKNLDVDIECEDIHITANEELLKHVWLNLIGNAIKFTPEGGLVTITATATPAAATVTIGDTGIGMSEEVQQHLFDKFYQGDTSHATQGNGLGLSLVQRILALSSGGISVQSREGEGSSFVVTLPRNSPPPKAELTSRQADGTIQ